MKKSKKHLINKKKFDILITRLNYYDKICHGGRRDNMKKDIHPEVKDCTVTCACGNTFTCKSTKSEINVEICSECHPFYTGKQSRASRAGRVDKFNKKYGFTAKEAE